MRIQIFFGILLLSSVGFAFDFYTHQWIGGKVCSDFNCSCMLETRAAAIAPDLYPADYPPQTHFCYNTSWDCSDSEYWTCPTKDYCPALERADYFIEKAKTQDGCEQWISIGIAAHYFSDSNVFWHRVMLDQKQFVCHLQFENAIGNQLREPRKMETEWNVSVCNVSLSYPEFIAIIDEFEKKLDFVIGQPKPKLYLLANSIDYALAGPFIEFLGSNGVDVVQLNAENFQDYKNEKFIIVLGGPDAPEGIGEIVQEGLSEEEQAYIREEKGNRKMYTKTNLWNPGQIVVFLSGYDRYDTQQVEMESKYEVYALTYVLVKF